jgi:lysophospholipase L1-like esterase
MASAINKERGSWSLLVLLGAIACGSSEGASSEAAPPGSAGPASSGTASPAAGVEASGVNGAAANEVSPERPASEGVNGAGVALDPSASSASGGSEAPASADPTPGATDPSSSTDTEAPADSPAAGPAPSERPAVDPATLSAVTLHLAGDSTVMKYAADSAQEGWGQELAQLFIDKVSIDNQAIGGASVASFHASSRWTNIMQRLEAGDYVMGLFGANDSGFTADRHVDPPDFKALFSQMADEVAAQDATFIVVTPSALQEWRNGEAGNVRLGPYVTVLRELGQEKGLLIDDLNARSLEFLNGIGQEAAKQIYINGDKAHFTKQGATQMAELVAAELPRIGSPLADYLK